MNKKTVALTKEQYTELIDVLRNGFAGSRPNDRIATALVLEANLGIRVSDILKLRITDIVKDGDRYRLDITEQKTQKKRTFTVPAAVYIYIQDYCMRNGIRPTERLFAITERAVQKQLKLACEYLGSGYENISTHSFRKFYATNIYINNNYNVVLVQQLLQHSSPTITQKYIGIGTPELEKAIQNNLDLL